MPPKRAAENNRESEEKRQRVDDSLNVENNLQNTADPALTISPALIETLVSRVADEVTRRLQPQHTEPLPGTSSEEQPSSPKPAQEVADPQEKTNSLVEQAVFSVSQSLAGEQNPVPGRLFHSSSLPIDCKVSDKVRAKIWANEFIDFGVLLSNPIFENKFKIAVQTVDSSGAPSLCLESASKPRKIFTIDQWGSCFLVFVGVYTSKFPSEAPSLMKYGETIRDLAARGHDWRFYDENFRFSRQSHSSSMPWGTIHGELWLRAQSSFANNRKPVLNFTGKQNLRVPAGYCFKFHKGGHCDGCAYSHNCFKCDGNHRVNSCTFRRPSQPSAFTPQVARSPSSANTAFRGSHRPNTKPSNSSKSGTA